MLGWLNLRHCHHAFAAASSYQAVAIYSEEAKMKSSSIKSLIRDIEAASLLGCSRATFWRRVADGTFPKPIRICGITRWDLTDIISVIETAKRQR